MRVIVANKFWYRRAGLEQVMFDEIEALTAEGHEVAHFSTTHPRNEPSPYAAYFVPYLELGGATPLSARERAVAAVRLFSNAEAARRFDRLVREFRPDVLHAHGIHRQLSPSILQVAKRHGVPVVQTLHDAHKICPEDRLLRAGSQACDPPRCRRMRYGSAVANRCAHGSVAVSVLASAELAYQRARRVYETCVDRYTSPSRFLAQRMREDGWETPIDVVPNPVRPTEPGRRSGDYFLYAGRLARGKGIEVLLEATSKTGLRTVVAGEGPLAVALAKRFPSAEFTGFMDPDGVRGLLREARAAVLPSTCVENAPLGVLEAMAAGVPVVATTVGGVPELIEDGVEGFLVPPGDAGALASALCRLRDDAGLARGLGDAGRRRVEQRNGIESHMAELLRTYERAMGSA